MKVSDLFQQLSVGELKNLALANEGAGSIRDSDKGSIILHARDALLNLYSRFILKERELILELQENTHFYWLLPKHATSYDLPDGQTDVVRYIKDTEEEPFIGDLIKVLSVWTECGCQLPLNDAEHCDSLFTPQANRLQVPHTCDEERISLLYQAKHPDISADLEEAIELPDVLWPALRAYIAYKVFSHMNTQESTTKAQEHLAFFESVCRDAEAQDLVSTSISTSNTRFSKRGWV